MDSEDEPLLFQAVWDLGEFEEQAEEEEDEEDEEEKEKEGCGGGVEGRGGQVCRGLWWAVGWVYTQPWASGAILVVGFLVPLALSAYMFLYCEPLDIDLSYSAFEVRSHSSAERFDALAIALKSQLGSWDRHRRDAEGFDFDSNALRDLLLLKLNRQAKDSPQATNETKQPGGLSCAQVVADATPVPVQEERTRNVAANQKKEMDIDKDSKVESANSGLNGDTRVSGLSPALDDTRRLNQQQGIDSKVTNETNLGSQGSQDWLKHGRTTSSSLHPTMEPTRTEAYNQSSSSHIRKPRFATYSYLQTQALWRIELVFVAQGDKDSNIFTPERLRTIHNVERLLMQHPQFQQFCWKPLEVLRDLPLGPSYCSPPSSLLSYLFPSERAGKIYFDGMGPDLADIHGALSLAITHPQFYWYVDEMLTPDSLHSSLLRSEIHFGAPLPSFYSLQDRPLEQRRRFRDFVVQYADILAQQSTSKVKVLYGGTELFDDEVRKTFHSDMLLALFSGACITVLVYVLTSFSLFLTFVGLASIGLSCLVALFVYHVVFKVEYLGILNGVAAFVIIGIGVDDVFVFISTFRQAAHVSGAEQRMIYTVKTAGRATFLTSFTTAAAYAANAFSQIPAVHDFGLFMSLIVSCCWLWVSILMPAALCVWDKWGAVQANACSKWWSTLTKLSVNLSPLSDEDDDVALLTVEMEPGLHEAEADAALLSLSVELPPDRSAEGNVGVVSAKLQRALRQWVAEPVVKKRKTIVVVYILVLLASACCCSLLKPASHAPVLFHRDTNLQRLLDLRSNLSAQGISCHMCSGVFMERPHSLHNSVHSMSSTSRKQHSPSSQTEGSQRQPDPRNSTHTLTDGLLTVYVFKLEVDTPITLYRYSLNGSAEAPWRAVTTGHGDVPSFQAYSSRHGNFSAQLTVCVSHAYHPRPRWMLTRGSCDPRHGWRSEFSFFVALAEQKNSRKLYFAQNTLSPYPSRVCDGPAGCMVGSGPVGPTQGSFYAPLPAAPKQVKSSVTSGFNPCSGGGCGKPAVRPLVDTGAMVFVVFGILGVNRTQHADNHVIGDLGSVIYDPDFDLFNEIGHLCQLCKAISANTQLVKPGGAQCLPSGNSLSSILPVLHPDCHSLPEPNLLPGQLSHGAVGMQGGRVHWISMAFESTTYKGKSSFQTHSDFVQWESFLQEQLASLPQSSALRRGFQTCQHWKQIFMEIIGVESALYSLLLSLAICIASVAVFTAHPLLLLPILLSILGVVCLVVAVMYWLGWEMGAVEAISLSILVGSSVDYCLHLVEGYLLAGDMTVMDPSTKRQERTVEAVNHVGVAIVSSAVTTVISTVPLFFCVIVPFSKFGQIVAINTAISILFTLVVTTALLATIGPSDFSRPPRAVLKASLVVLVVGATGCVLWWTGSQFIPVGWKSLIT
ncbi:protein dispatched homolog 3 [Astyanax mexicanus]|uniref:protein dispatched homolog 3 n=1 Tax=Astyanax mexicanus TaxID=7994 RepID=UPI0020CAFBF6|nr:protein dispatched homolog 3 [Astyanax mexicanus]XP_022526846.2 protein dispatched homolog 3 [Astyanax mexicanus]